MEFSVRIILFSFLVVTTLSATTVSAQSDGFFVGFHGAVTQSEVTYAKVIDNTHPDNPSTVAGKTFSTSGTGDGNLANLGGIAGFRWPNGNGWFSLQFELNVAAGRVNGFVAGEGDSPTRAQYGEAWPETFSIESSQEIGSVFKWGWSLQSSTWTAITGYYVLGGLKYASSDMKTTFDRGCFSTSPCTGTQFQSGNFEYESTGTALFFGGGLEHSFNDRLFGQLEIRFEGAIDNDWLDLYENGTLTVAPTLESQSVKISLNLLRVL